MLSLTSFFRRVIVLLLGNSRLAPPTEKPRTAPPTAVEHCRPAGARDTEVRETLRDVGKEIPVNLGEISLSLFLAPGKQPMPTQPVPTHYNKADTLLHGA